jgi:hypothetical protein
MWWDRNAHDVANDPKPWERSLANVIWCGSLAVLVAAPVVVSFIRRFKGEASSLVLPLVAGVVAGLYLLGGLVWGWPRLPELLNSDLELVGGTYLVTAVAFSLALYEAIRSNRSGLRSRAAGGVGVALVCAAVVAVSSYVLVFVE